MSPKRAIIERVWEKAVGRPFSLTEFVEHLAQEGGYDMHELSQQDLAALVEDRFEGDWDEVAWAFGELAYYFAACVEDGKLEPEALVCWVAWVLITGELFRRGCYSQWRELGFFLTGLHVLQAQLPWDEIPAILGEAFRGAPPSA